MNRVYDIALASFFAVLIAASWFNKPIGYSILVAAAIALINTVLWFIATMLGQLPLHRRIRETHQAAAHICPTCQAHETLEVSSDETHEYLITCTSCDTRYTVNQAGMIVRIKP